MTNPVERNGAETHHRPISEWDPVTAHDGMRRRCHVRYWVVLSHEAVRGCRRDPQHFSSEHDVDGSHLGLQLDCIGIPPQGHYRSIPSETDGPAFHQYRRLLLP
jgi:hypothetical protein